MDSRRKIMDRNRMKNINGRFRYCESGPEKPAKKGVKHEEKNSSGYADHVHGFWSRSLRK